MAVSLWEAVVADNEEEVSSLLKQGANPDHELFFSEEWVSSRALDLRFQTHPLLVACINGNLSMVRLLTEKGRVDANRNLSARANQLAPLHMACNCAKEKENTLDLVRYLTEEAKCNVGKIITTPLQSYN